MDKLYVLDCMNARVVIISVSEKQEKILNEKYDNNTECWLVEEGIDDKVGINVSCCTFMWVYDSETAIEEYSI